MIFTSILGHDEAGATRWRESEELGTSVRLAAETGHGGSRHQEARQLGGQAQTRRRADYVRKLHSLD